MSFAGIQRLASKPFTSPEIRVAKADASKWVIGPMPERPLTTPSQLDARSTPSGDRMPRPVMATRRLVMFDSLLSIHGGVAPRPGAAKRARPHRGPGVVQLRPRGPDRLRRRGHARREARRGAPRASRLDVGLDVVDRLLHRGDPRRLLVGDVA